MKGSRFNRIVTWNVGLSELEKWDCLSPAVKVNFMCWVYWILSPLDFLAFTLGTQCGKKREKSMYGSLINSVLLEQVFDYRRRKRTAVDSYFCCFTMSGSYRVRLSGSFLQGKVFHYEEKTSCCLSCKAQARAWQAGTFSKSSSLTCSCQHPSPSSDGERWAQVGRLCMEASQPRLEVRWVVSWTSSSLCANTS